MLIVPKLCRHRTSGGLDGSACDSHGPGRSCSDRRTGVKWEMRVGYGYGLFPVSRLRLGTCLRAVGRDCGLGLAGRDCWGWMWREGGLWTSELELILTAFSPFSF